ncbi:hypothetical protein GCM10027064_15840 [Microbacterium petrolearium]
MYSQQATAKETPELSVVMPTKNVAAWVAEAAQSVLSQSVPDVELIVVDDGSTDGTLDVLRRIEDPRLRVVSNPGEGGGTARNYGASLARGTYLAFADGDDVLPEKGYEALLSQANRTRAEMVVANYVIFSPTQLNSRHQWFPLYGRVREGITIEDEPIFLRDRVCWNRIFLRKAWESAGIRFADSPRSNDIQAMTDAYCAFAFDVIPDVVYMYRRRSGASSMTARKSAPDSVTAHFEQELGCLASVRRLQSPTVWESYSREMLANDVWAHFTPLVDIAYAEDNAYDAAREAALRFVRQTMPSGAGALDPSKRAVYTMAIAGRWSDAAQLHSELKRDFSERKITATEVARALGRAGASRASASVEALRVLHLSELSRPGGLPDDALLGSLRAARRFARRHVRAWHLRRDERYLLSADPARGAEAVRDHLSSAAPGPRLPVRAARHALDDVHAAAHAARRVGRRAVNRAMDAARGASMRLPGPVRIVVRSAFHRLRPRR